MWPQLLLDDALDIALVLDVTDLNARCGRSCGGGAFLAAAASYSRLAHEPQLVRKRGDKVAVVRDDDDGAVEGVERIEQSLERLKVEVIRGLVEEQQVRPAGQDDRRHHEAGTLAARQLPNASMGEMRAAKAHRSEEVARVQFGAAASLLDDVLRRREVEVALELLEVVLLQVRDAQVVLPRRIPSDRLDAAAASSSSATTSGASGAAAISSTTTSADATTGTAATSTSAGTAACEPVARLESHEQRRLACAVGAENRNARVRSHRGRYM